MKRVVITGMGTISPIGNTMEQIFDSLMNNRSGVSVMDEWHDINALRVCLAGRCKGFDAKRIHRRDRRTMGRMAVMAGLSTLDAIQMAGLETEMVSSPTTGISMGSTTGSGEIIEKTFTDFFPPAAFPVLKAPLS